MNLTKFYIDQHGCAKNQTDGEYIVGYLIKEGFEHTFDAELADFIIINSCGFIESAKKESIDAIYDIKKSYPKAKLILAGCLAERYADVFFKEIPELDGIFGNGNISKIADFMKEVQKERCVRTYEQKGIFTSERPVLFNYKSCAYVKITEGCSNNCSFCAIPLIRGKVRSCLVEDIICEIKGLLQDGIYEINLIGQDLAAFSLDERKEVKDISALCYLLKEISALEGDFLIRLLYIHPDHFNTDILDVMEKDKRFARYFDIPFQSGDDGIIKAMNRTGSAKQYIELVKSIRSRLPSCVIRTTFLTGFPGESDKAAENTYNFLKEIKADWSGCFPYSREEDTLAYSMKGQVSGKVAQKRAEKLQALQMQITQENLKKYIGQEVDVLVEEVIELPSDKQDSSEGLAIGRAYFQAPEVDGNIVIRYEADDENEVKAIASGNIVTVKIINVSGVDLDSRFLKLQKPLFSNKIYIG